MYQQCDDHGQKDDNQREDDISGIACRPFLREPVADSRDTSCLLSPLNIVADALHAVHLFHVDEAVLQCCGLLVGHQRSPPVASVLAQLVVEGVDFSQVFRAVYVSGY